ncbi:MAG: PTS sugar transporter subunit IIA [Lachnospiraceae bacterium]|nr:PTS sugar transporter subunit IIA [Lachnospiraceae bacterium]
MKIFLSTHGKMASGIKSSLDILMGNTDCLTVYDAYLPDDSGNVREHADAFFAATPETELKLLISDLYGGSVNQQLVQYIDHPNTYIIAGANLAMLITLISSADDNSLTKADIEQIIADSRQMTKMVSLDFEVETDDFF